MLTSAFPFLLPKHIERELPSKLRALASDLEGLSSGAAPADAILASAPLLVDWRGVLTPMGLRLSGFVAGHPLLGNRPALTSQVWAADADGHWIRTLSRYYRPWVGKRVPLVFTKNVQDAFKKLVAEPHARSVIDPILRDTAGSRTTIWRPTLLVGRPGSGKTRLAVRICQELGVPHRVFSCAGASDSSFAGTSRHWSTGRPSIPLQTIRQHDVANVAIILDEIEKVALSRHAGTLADVLLTVLEPLNASRVFDLYLEGEVDVSRVLWLATANDLSMLHPALLDRFRILEMPDPRAEDLHAVLPGVVGTVAERRGLSREWIAPFDALEIDMIADLWRGGSIRRLSRIVEAMFDARDRPEKSN